MLVIAHCTDPSSLNTLGSYRATATDAGRDDRERPTTSAPDERYFTSGRDDPVDAGVFCQGGEFGDAVGGRPGDADFAQRSIVHAGENRDRQETRAIGAHGHAGTDGLHRSLQHNRAAERVNVEQFDPR